MRTTLVNEGLEYHGSQETPGRSMSNFTSPPSPAPMRSPIHLELAPHKKGIKSDDPPQNVDISYLSDATSSTTNLDEACPLAKIHPASHLNYKTIQVLIVLKLNLFLIQKDNRIIPTFHQQMFSLDTMTMNCSYYKRRMMHQMVISTIRTLITLKIKMPSSPMPPS